MLNIDMVEVHEAPYLYVERTCSMNPQDISRSMGMAFGTVASMLARKGIREVGRPLSVYYTHDEGSMTFRAGFLVSDEGASAAEGEVQAGVLPAGNVLNFVHYGPYSTLRVSYAEMMRHLDEKGLAVGAPTWEIYLNDPESVPAANLETDCYVTVAAT